MLSAHRVGGASAEVSVSELHPLVAARYAPFTLAVHRPLLETLGQAAAGVAVGASVAGEPVGLAMARPDSARLAKILSIYVRRDHRRRGIGRRLVSGLERALVARGCEAAVLLHARHVAGADQLACFLTACEWPSTGEWLHYITTDGRIMSCDWFTNAVLPAPFAIGSWASVTEAERSALHPAREGGGWIPERLIPSDYDADFERLNSLVLRRDGVVVGWLISQRLAPRVVRYANIFVRPAVNRVGRTFATLGLIAEAVRRQAHALGPLSRGRFEVAPDNLSLLRFIDRHFAGYILERSDMQRIVKPLPHVPPVEPGPV